MNWGAIEATATLVLVASTLGVSLVNYGDLRRSVKELGRRVGELELWKEKKQERAEAIAAGHFKGGHSVV